MKSLFRYASVTFFHFALLYVQVLVVTVVTCAVPIFFQISFRERERVESDRNGRGGDRTTNGHSVLCILFLSTLTGTSKTSET